MEIDKQVLIRMRVEKFIQKRLTFDKLDDAQSIPVSEIHAANKKNYEKIRNLRFQVQQDREKNVSKLLKTVATFQ